LIAAKQAKKKEKKPTDPAERKKLALGKVKTIFTKKNYSDATAALMYGLSCSLIHLAMLFTIFFVKSSDIAAAKKFD